jgi:hypothetical protein
MKRGVSRYQDPAMFDQLQAEAISAIRGHIVWFVFAVDEEMKCTLAIACPEQVESDTITGSELYQMLLHGVIGAACDALIEVAEDDSK